MRTATPNLLILTVQTDTNNITGTAIDADILVNFAVANTEVNQRLFVPEAQLVVTGKFRLGKQLATIGILISSVVVIVSIPAPASAEIADSAVATGAESSTDVKSVVEPEIAAVDVESSAPSTTQPAQSQTRAQKAAATRAAKKAKTKAESVPC
ncbi:hypothetical protein [Chamaesiphon minutus]|jgi:hypothetical protein|uniref:Uncharacterized protein n=1 Tax=Chamaesiphon minutus (strain ATCC 27169 / PCC 6605) TaxID=1173020 RepID=K9UDG5_CHAP6|nr:hypothetical protein [Chamaesiphon minutus]AFY92855.1 hypothetical protein Cha6605_1730 [Chamaesiphon minutus PCC 6605]